MELETYLTNQGYEIQKYFTGSANKTYNLHFRGDFLSSHATQRAAILYAIFHDDEMTIKILSR